VPGPVPGSCPYVGELLIPVRARGRYVATQRNPHYIEVLQAWRHSSRGERARLGTGTRQVSRQSWAGLRGGNISKKGEGFAQPN
jgi:hypothetical protein